MRTEDVSKPGGSGKTVAMKVKAMKASRASSTARESGLSMEPRYVASRAYYKRRKEVLAEKAAAAGLESIKDASRLQLKRWDVVAKTQACKIHTEIMENSRTPSLD